MNSCGNAINKNCMCVQMIELSLIDPIPMVVEVDDKSSSIGLTECDEDVSWCCHRGQNPYLVIAGHRRECRNEIILMVKWNEAILV